MLIAKEKLYERLAELAEVEKANRNVAALRLVWTEQFGIYQQLLQIGCNQLPGDANSVEERMLELSNLL